MATSGLMASVLKQRAGDLKSEWIKPIALTAFSRPEDRDEALHAGFQVLLSKPVNADALKATVSRLLHARHG